MARGRTDCLVSGDLTPPAGLFTSEPKNIMFLDGKCQISMVPILTGPFALNQSSINKNVTLNSPGAYVLGKTNAVTNKFPVSRSGRSDDDLPGRLANHIGDYDEFMYVYCKDATSAFYAECELHHEYSPKDNIYHPDRPNGKTSLKCPRCKVFD
jgi:hypothetical protein